MASDKGAGTGAAEVVEHTEDTINGDGPDVLHKIKRRAFVIPERLTRAEREQIARDIADIRDDEWAERPKTRGECKTGQRPCPWVGCRHHLAIEVTEVGNLKLNFPDKDLESMKETCSLDVADLGGVTLEDTGSLLNFTRERARQVEVTILAKLNSEWRKLEGEDNAD